MLFLSLSNTKYKDMDKKVRVRFAPSPTGPLHIGGVRTALFNYLFAKKNKGTFILRIEDTDQTRFVDKAEEYIIESLKWCGISPDEGQGVGGDYGPYKQSERKSIYKKFVLQLIENGNAYYAFDTPEDLSVLRKDAEQNKTNFVYDALTRKNLNNSLTLSSEEVKKKIAANEAYVVRFKMPEQQEIKMNDIIRGDISVNSKDLDDKVLFKSDGMPTYHLANIVDDYLMKITHVIRGEEWLPSLPLHVMLYKAFGWEKEMPQFAHLPLILKPQGNGKLSKRDGDKLGFPVFPLEWHSPDGNIARGYKEDGYFSDAFVNMLALLGWNPGTEQELFSLKELENIFTLDRVGKSGAKFDPEKAKWFNQQYLRKKTDNDLVKLISPILKKKGYNSSEEKLKNIISLVKDRMGFVSDFWNQACFFFEQPIEYNPKVVKKRWKTDVPNIMLNIKDIIIDQNEWNTESLHQQISRYLSKNEIGMGKAMNALRLAMTGDAIGPDLMNLIILLGKEEAALRIQNAIERINK